MVKFAQLAPFGPFKVVIAVLDGASAQAQNILLKVLEEPPLLHPGSRRSGSSWWPRPGRCRPSCPAAR